MGAKKNRKKKYVIKKKKTNKSGKKVIKKKNNNQKIKHEITGIIILSLGLLVFLGFYINDSMGVFGMVTRNVLTGLLGIPSVFIPFLLIIFPILLIIRKDKEAVKRKSIYTAILLVLIAAIFQTGIYEETDFINRSPVSCIVKFYKDGNKLAGGGVGGGIIALPLLLLFQPLGTIIILSTASIVVTILLTNISLFGIVKKLAVSIITQIRAIGHGIKEGRADNASDENFDYSEYEDNQNVYTINKGRNNKDIENDQSDGRIKGMGFTFNFSGVNLDDEIEHEDHKFNSFKLIEGKSKENKENTDIDTSLQVEIDENRFAVEKAEEAKEVSDVAANDIEVTIKSEQTIKETLYKYPPLSLLNESPSNDKSLKSYRNAAIEGAKKLEETLGSFGVEAKVVNVSMGPTVTRFELQPSAGVKVSRIVNLADDIALNLASSGVRIEAPIPGKAAVGIEVPNKEVTPVLLREVLESNEFNNHSSKVAFAVGKDISGECIVADIAKMPHLLIAGATGSGKSVCINSLIMSILYKSSPDEVKMLLIDPKVVELGVYNGIPHLLIPVVTDPKKAAGALNWAVQEMINRYKLFADKGVRDIKGYNEQVSDLDEQEKLPTIIIIIDELSDLMMAAPGDVEDAICRLAQMARAAGMHLVVATQRPSVDVITGLIKANIPSRISFAVSSQVDSRTILDMGGAEKLLGKGDMLFYPTGRQKPLRVQGAFVSDREVEKTVEFIKSQSDDHEYDNSIIDEIDNSSTSSNDNMDQEYDELLPQAIEVVVDAGQASVSMIQRKFKVGYARAARMIDQMEARGIIGGFEGSKPRQVLISRQQWEEMKLSSSI